MKITIYELLGLIKDGKAPKKINEIINGIKYGYKFNENTQWYETLDETTTMSIFEKERLDHKVEIIEEVEDKEYEDIEEITYKPRKVQNTINALIRNQKKILERLDKNEENINE